MSLAANSQASPKRPRVLVVANQKGGVGKTTTAINLGTALAAVGEPTLVLDLDPQGNASTGLGVPRADRKLTTYDVLMGEADIEQAVIPTKIPRLSIVPATVDLSGAELELINIERRNFRLKDAIAHYSVHGASQFSYILIDCPPSLSLLTVNAMAAADAVVVPLQCEFFALEGLSQLLKTIERVRAEPKMADEHRRHGLGRGLAALIGEDVPVAPKSETQSRNQRTVPIAFLRPNRFQPRKNFAADDLNDLCLLYT